MGNLKEFDEYIEFVRLSYKEQFADTLEQLIRYAVPSIKNLKITEKEDGNFSIEFLEEEGVKEKVEKILNDCLNSKPNFKELKSHV